MIEMNACVATQSWVNREYRSGLSTHSCVAPVLRINVVVSCLHYLGMDRQEVQDPVAQGGIQTQGPNLNDELGGYYAADG